VKKLIRDKRGRVLEFSQERDETLVYFRLEFHRACAAYVHCQIEDEVLVLTDMFVEEKCIVPEPSILRRLLGHKIREENFRRQGLGSQLLTTMIIYARSKKLKRIEGQLMEKDTLPNPQLSRWYQKRGFTVDESKISMNLTFARQPADDSRYMPKALATATPKPN
jgi:GNAT superfamily N-acetyltransferase